MKVIKDNEFNETVTAKSGEAYNISDETYIKGKWIEGGAVTLMAGVMAGAMIYMVAKSAELDKG